MVYGIEQIKKLISGVAHSGNLIAKIVPGGITTSDLAFAPEFFMLFPEFMAVDFKGFMFEAKDLTPEEIIEVIALFNREFDIPQDNIEWTIESILTLLNEVVALVVQGRATFLKVLAIFKNKPQA